jgi:hypothetical protein
MPLQSDQLLEIIAITGELPAAAFHRLPFKESYRYNLMAGLKEKKLVRSYSRNGLKGYRLTNGAKELLLARNPKRFGFFLTGSVETNKLHSEYTRRLRLHHTAEATVTLTNAGVNVFPDEKPTLFAGPPADVSKPPEAAFYYSREVKAIEDEHLKIRSSRIAGVLFTAEEILLTYNSGGNLMKWEYQTELRCKALMEIRFWQNTATAIYRHANVNGLMLGAGMDMALPLLTSTGGHKRQYFYLDESFERFYYAPNTPEGEAQIRIICSVDARNELSDLLLSDLAPMNPGLYIEHDALTHEGVPVLLAFDFDMQRLRRFHMALNQPGTAGEVYCFDFQKPLLEKYLDGMATFKSIDLEKTRRRFFDT